ncbi:MAG: DUF1761 domain-containing protein [Acidimicrobiia bacterium]|nr:DUF1761 domain-containing protein [Acidimicrobiia bacterium]
MLSFADLNWLAVLVAGLAYLIIGAVWYTDALMGRQYRAALGLDPDTQGTPDPSLLVTNLMGWLVSALALGLVMAAAGASGVGDGIIFGLVVGVGFIVTQMLVTSTYEGRGMALFKVNAPYVVIGYVVMGIILATWQ